MAIYSKEYAEKILDKALSYSTSDECEVRIIGADRGDIRYARNSVSTAAMRSNVRLQVMSIYGKKSGRTAINEFDDASLKRAIKRSEELARLAPENPEYMPMLGPQKYEDEPCMYVDSTANISPEYRAEVAASGIETAKTNNSTAAGFLSNASIFNCAKNTKGLSTYFQRTAVNFSVTMRTNDGTGSGWARRDFNDVDKLDAAEASRIAVDKALMSKDARTLEPGKYTVILEPDAASELLGPLQWGFFSARRADEGRSFMSKKSGGTKLGEKIVDDRITIYSDPLHPEVPTPTHSDDGLPSKKTIWIENGVAKNLAYNRFWAQKKGVDPLPGPGNIIIVGGNASLEEMIQGTEKGILVTRLWYIRQVNPKTLLHTGLTRDGTFLIENGKIKHPIKNFRFNESPIIMLNNLEALGQQSRVWNYMVPIMKIRNFNFTSLSDAI